MIIKINLIGRRAKPKPTTSRAQLLLFAGLLVVEALFLFVWYQKLSSELDTVKARVKEANSKLDELKRVKQAWEQWQAEKADLDRQTQVFESLKAEQIGPPTMLEYVSYVLTKVPDDASGADELKAQELVGWNPKWDPRRVWLTSISQRKDQVSLKGEAIDHEDVAEFYRRLQSSDFFHDVEPGLQTRKFHDTLQLKLVEFSVTAQLNYRLGTAGLLDEGEKPAKEGAAPAPQGAALSVKPMGGPLGQ